jgi:hypothetical protein
MHEEIAMAGEAQATGEAVRLHPVATGSRDTLEHRSRPDDLPAVTDRCTDPIQGLTRKIGMS